MSVVVTLSTQSIASLAVAHSLSPGETARKLAGFLRKLGVKAVVDAGTGRDLALLEAAAEFIQRYKDVHPQSAGKPQLSDCLIQKLYFTPSRCFRGCPWQAPNWPAQNQHWMF